MTFTTEQQVREYYVSILTSWIGKSEYNGGHREIVDIYNTQNPLPVGYKVSYYDAWCATTVSAAAVEAKFTSIIPCECSCPRMVKLAKSWGIWQENDAYVPKMGDIVMYDWQDNGVGDNVGTPDHVGVVKSVNGMNMVIIEGNMSGGQVGTKNLIVNARYIRGYITPKFYLMVGKVAPEAKPIYRDMTQKRFGFDNNTMMFLDKHPWKDSLYEKLATKE